MATGRPRIYNEDLQARADYYVDEGFEEEGDVVPSIAGLACSIRVDRSTIYAWRDTYPIFSDTLQRVKEKQERMLVSGGLSSAMNSTIVKLMMANHGYSDKAEQTVTGTMTNTNINSEVPKEDLRDFIKQF